MGGPQPWCQPCRCRVVCGSRHDPPQPALMSDGVRCRVVSASASVQPVCRCCNCEASTNLGTAGPDRSHRGHPRTTAERQHPVPGRRRQGLRLLGGGDLLAPSDRLSAGERRAGLAARTGQRADRSAGRLVARVDLRGRLPVGGCPTRRRCGGVVVAGASDALGLGGLAVRGGGLRGTGLHRAGHRRTGLDGCAAGGRRGRSRPAGRADRRRPGRRCAVRPRSAGQDQFAARSRWRRCCCCGRSIAGGGGSPPWRALSAACWPWR